MPTTLARTVRELMHQGCECIGENETVLDAAMRMERLDIGALPIRGEDDRLRGMLTDRDIVVKVIAQGKDPATMRVGELAEGEPVTVRADEAVDEALRLMGERKVKRLPVIGEEGLVGIVSEADLATHVPEGKLAGTVESIAAAPPQHY